MTLQEAIEATREDLLAFSRTCGASPRLTQANEFVLSAAEKQLKILEWAYEHGEGMYDSGNDWPAVYVDDLFEFCGEDYQTFCKTEEGKE